MENKIYENVTVEISKNRWNVVVTISDGYSYQEFVASADSFYTEDSGIFFGTREEYEEWYERFN